MKRKLLVLVLSLMVLGFTACCSNCDKNCENEVSECSKERAKGFTEMLTERLELTVEQAASIEKLLVNKFEQGRRERELFHAEMGKILGAEKFEAYKEVLKECPRKRHCHATMEGKCCKGENACEKADSCKDTCAKNACQETTNNTCCKKKCSNK